MTTTTRDAQTLAERYIATWNETDSARRRELLAALWAQDATYEDPMGRAQGLGQIDGMIAAVQQRFEGLHFSLAGRADGYGSVIRFAWRLGSDGAESLVDGTDFADLENGRLKRVTGFLDKIPAP